MKRGEIITLSLGPQFRGGKAAYLFLVFLFMLILFLIFLFEGRMMEAFLTLPVLVLMMYFILDIRGVQIDTGVGAVRMYKVYVWGKSGDWKDFKKFDQIRLNYESFKVKVAKFYSEAAGMNTSSTENHGHFVIKLHSTEDQQSFVIAERNKYKEAKTLSKQIAKRLQLPFEDQFEKRLIASKKRRGR